MPRVRQSRVHQQKPYSKGKSEEPKKKVQSPLFVSRPKNFGIGGTIQPKRDLTRYVKWPKYVRIQRQRSIIYKRLKTPPALNQFSFTLNKNLAGNLLQFLTKYAPETKSQKKERLQRKAESGESSSEKPYLVKYGLNHVTKLIEDKKAKLVVIAHNVDPIELVVWLPALCRKMQVPYCIIKGKDRLGAVIHQKNATCLAVTDVRDSDKAEFARLVEAIETSQVDDRTRNSWGDGILSAKSQDRQRKIERALEIERRKRM